jgi:sugar lactone lactonase YvrE
MFDTPGRVPGHPGVGVHSGARPAVLAARPHQQEKAPLKKALIVLALVAASLVIALRLRYGGGTPYPDLTTRPLFPESALETVVSYPEPIGNVAVSGDGRVFFTVHPESRPSGAKLLEWVDGAAVPYPDVDAQALFDTVLGLVVDQQNRLWTIDHGQHGTRTARLLAFDLETGERAHDYRFGSETAEVGSFLQDLQVNSSGTRVYVADVSFWRKNPGIVVYDVEERSAFRALDSHPSVSAQDWLIRTPGRDMRYFGGIVSLKPGIDGIALDKQDEWLYFGAMSHDGLFRIRTSDLNDMDLTAAELGERVERVGDKPLSDGLSIDLEDRIYLTDVEHGAIMRMTGDGELMTLVRSPRIRWADALSFGPGQWLYIADSALADQMLMSKEHIAARGPYNIYRLEVDARGVAGQ